MKSCKKILLLVIALVLVLNINVKAADYATEPSDTVDNVTLIASVTEAKVGDKVTITVRANCSTGIGGVDATLDWDKTKLEFSNEDNFQLSGLDETTGEFKFSVLYDGDELEDDVAVLEFTVLDTATAGETKISFSNIAIIDYDYEDIVIDDKEAVITIIGEGEEETPGENVPGGEAPGGNLPGEDDPEGETPGGDTPSGDEPGGETPGGDEPEGEAPGGDTPGTEQKPSDDKTPAEDKKDDTIADKEINNAGAEEYALMLIAATGIVVIALYIKCKKYSDVI